jgi:4'-phosphopantetheinyl transferase EntD
VLERLLPAGVAVVESREDVLDQPLYPQEAEIVARAVEKRRREFATGRACARAALCKLGHDPAPILSGSHGEPRWPAGVVGSITHCDGYRACAVAAAEQLAGLGIDAEPDAPLPDGLLADVALPGERRQLAALAAAEPSISWDRLLFSAKEAVYKAWFAVAERWLGFEDAELGIDPRAGAFSARLLVPGPLLGDRPLDRFSGAWTVADGIVLTAVAVPSPARRFPA